MTPDPNVAAAFAAAATEWNNLSSSAGVHLDPLPNGQTLADIQIQLTTDASGNPGGCAAYSADTSRIYYGETFLQAVQTVSTGTTILAHELGHAFGLADGGTNPNPPSIMNNPSNSLPGGCTSPVVPTTSVQSNDAATIPACTKQATALAAQLNAESKTTLKFDMTPSYAYTSFPVCTYTYDTLNFYVDGVFDSSEQYISSISCQ